MSTDLFLNSTFGDNSVNENSGHSTNGHDEIDAETLWLINEIIKPELPNISDNVSLCLQMLENDQVYKMPVSNGVKEGSSDVPWIKGVVSRKQEYITGFRVMVRFPDFQNGKVIALEMRPNFKYLLTQFGSISNNLHKIISLLDDLETMTDIHQFIKIYKDIVQILDASINLLQAPPSKLTYPENNNEPMKQIFENYKENCDNSTNLIALDLILVKNELCIDFRNLNKVTKKPWCTVDPNTGKSFIDKIKDELMTARTKNVKLILEENGLTVEDSNFLNILLNSTFKPDTTTTLAEAQDYLRRGSTFDGSAVTESSKIMASTSDPILICVSSKLNGLKYSIDNHYENLKIHH
ncbi:similar to Saccharomyces cerevisiae YDR202C RAV2 Subunit of RAVE [Maudiozyma saulgeensis]|uniref:Similar to Saccharomyces cerevisiae YDR202C RAV2 Subunit of RAVE n=1 Tax=Maudiozyma saulgeensis TaxID=1789683 RepID=A0A1X7R5F0_9SACH|nr:similar to Saccharomyces cerevisiae YDR202C RAV2 Subunit of RAVE [Kazachstania saulgeensis]